MLQYTVSLCGSNAVYYFKNIAPAAVDEVWELALHLITV